MGGGKQNLFSKQENSDYFPWEGEANIRRTDRMGSEGDGQKTGEGGGDIPLDRASIIADVEITTGHKNAQIYTCIHHILVDSFTRLQTRSNKRITRVHTL